MATWSKRSFAPGRVTEWAAVQDAFDKVYTATFSKHWSPKRRGEMMLLHKSMDDATDVLYMALPDGLSPFNGFEPVAFKDIPSSPSVLVADQIGYDELFRR